MENLKVDLKRKLAQMCVNKGLRTNRMLAVDVGSTEIRGTMFNTNAQMSEVLRMQSPYAIITEDISHVKSQSEEIFDNLEIVIKDVTPEEQLRRDRREDVRIIRGGLLQDIEAPVTKINSSEGKIDQDSTYINIITIVAMNCLIKGECSQGSLGYLNEIDLTVSLPPKDTRSTTRLNKFKDTLNGTYLVDFVRLGVSFTIHFSFDKIFVEDESKAVLRYWKTAYETEGADEDSILVIDGGGSTIDLAVLKEGRLIDKACESMLFGGDKLGLDVAKIFANQSGDVVEKDPNRIRFMLENGYIRQGKREVSVKSAVHTAKIKMAREIMSKLEQVFGESDFTAKTFQTVILAGRLFDNCKQTNVDYLTPSLGAYLAKLYKGKSPDTDFISVNEVESIPYGLAFYRMSIA